MVVATEKLIVEVNQLFQEEMNMTERIKEHVTVQEQTIEVFKSTQKKYDEHFPSLENDLKNLLKSGEKASQLEKDFDFIGAARLLNLSVEENTQFKNNLELLDKFMEESQHLDKENIIEKPFNWKQMTRLLQYMKPYARLL